MNNLREVIYAMKHRFGTPVDIYSPTPPVLNPETGKNIISIGKQHIRKAVVVTKSLYNWVSTLGNKISKNSGMVETDITEFVIDSKDVRVPPNLNDYIDYNNSRYDISKIAPIDKNNKVFGWFITARKTSTSLLNKQADQIIWDQLVLAQTFNFTLLGPGFEDELEFIDSFLIIEI